MARAQYSTLTVSGLFRCGRLTGGLFCWPRLVCSCIMASDTQTETGAGAPDGGKEAVPFLWKAQCIFCATTARKWGNPAALVPDEQKTLNGIVRCMRTVNIWQNIIFSQ